MNLISLPGRLGAVMIAGFAVAGGICVADAADDESERVVVLANSEDDDSMRLAHFYAARRNIPERNIYSLALSGSESITWSTFAGELFNPLLRRLIGDGWIDAEPSGTKDEAGRIVSVVTGHRISYLVLCRGVPLRIGNDPSLQDSNNAKKAYGNLRRNHASVDSELALIATTPTDPNGTVENLLFENESPSPEELLAVVRVSRLDGPTLEDCKEMILGSLEAEQNGLRGRAYVDVGGPYGLGDRWLRTIRKQLNALDFDLSVQTEKSVFGYTDRFDAPALYFGWYANNIQGPFNVRDFRFPPGAIAFHIHSGSAGTLRRTMKGWSGPFVARGASATVGNVNEPYLQLAHRPDLLLAALARGGTLGEAAYFALPALSWQTIVLGDPLFRPFAVSLESQVERLKESDDDLAQYVALREANRLTRNGDSDRAVAWLREESFLHPGMAIKLRLAKELSAGKDGKGAAQALKLFADSETFTDSELALGIEAAEAFKKLGANADATAVYAKLIASSADDPVWQKAILPNAIAAARKSRQPALEREWRNALSKLEAE